MSDSLTHFSLEVAGLEVLRRSDTSSLYFKLKVGDQDLRTGIIRGKLPSTEPDVLTFSASDTDPLNIRVKETSKGLGKRVLGCIGDITVATLKERCLNGKVPLEFSPASGKASASPAGTIHVRLRAIDMVSRVEIDVKSATRCIDRVIRFAKAADPNETVGSFFKMADDVVKTVDDLIGKVHPLLGIAWMATSALYKVISSQFKKEKNFVDMVQAMNEAFEFARDGHALAGKTERLTTVIEKLLGQTIECCHFAEEYVNPGLVGRIFHVNGGRRIAEFKDCFTTFKANLGLGVGLHTAHKVDTIDLERKLAPALSDTTARPRCLPETRTKYLDQIIDWLSSPTDQNILWLNGIAGSGKSTIAATIRDCCDGQSCLAAYMFFERGKDEHRSIIRSIAYQLADYNKVIGSYIANAVERSKHVTGSSIAKQFETLLLEPLKAAADAVKGPVLVILDALDECGNVRQRREILQLLKTDFAMLPIKFRFLVTSRPEDDIMICLSSQRHIRSVILDHTSEDSRRDVDAFINMEMRRIVAEMPDNWEDMIAVLCNAANGLFIWASTAVKMVDDSDDPYDKLSELVRDVRLVGAYDLDELYGTVLRQSGISWHDARSRDRFTRVLGLILFTKESLTSETVDGILVFEAGKSRLTLQRLRSVIFYEPGKSICLHHASLADYLTSSERSGDKPWFIDEEVTRQAIIAQCFDIMKDSLRFNICNVGSSFVRNDGVPELKHRIEENILPRLSYACRFWADHLCDVSHSPELSSKLSDFAYNRLLYWFEVLSVTGSFNHIASRSLYNVFMWTPPEDEEMSSFLWAAYRLASVFALPMSQSAPHIYFSALSLWKDESAVANHFSRTHPTVQVHLLGTKPPDSCIKILKHKRLIKSVAVSTDGKYIASGSYACEVQIWDAESGELVLDLFEGHLNYVWSVVFSPDSRLVASGSEDGSVRVWSIESGELVSGPFEGHTCDVLTVAFSPDGKRIASGSVGCSIRVWDVHSGELILGPLKEHTESVEGLAFSPNGEAIISGSADASIRVWNAENGTLVSGPFLGHEGGIWSVAVSPDGNRVASGSDDCTIRVWDMDSGMPVFRPLEGHTGAVMSVVFSPDGKHIVSGSVDKTIRVWDAESGHLISGPFRGHMDSVNSVSIFPDGKRVVSGSDDCTIRFWDVQSSVATSGTFEGHKDRVTSVVFSPDGERVVSGSSDNTICIWDVKSGKLTSGPFEGHAEWITSVAFSPDGRLVASGSGHCSIRIWNVESGEDALLEGHTEQVTSVAFSSDGKYLVSGSWDNTIRVWDVDSCETILGPLKGHEYSVNSVAFSLDGKHLASGSDDHTIRVWDADSGEVVLGPMQGHTGSVYSVALSPDGQRIVSGSEDETIRIWSAETGQAIAGPFKGHTGAVTSVAFSPDGKYIASGSLDCPVRAWDADSGQVVLGPFMGHTDHVRSVTFSPCGRYLASGSSDRTIRIWSVDDVKDAVDVHGTSRSPSLSTDADRAAASAGRAAEISGLQGGGMSSTLPKECTAANWRVSEDGWIRGDQGELLIWIPEYMRTTLWIPQTVNILSCQFITSLDFAGSPLGENWCDGFPRLRNEGIAEQDQVVALNSPPEISRDDAERISFENDGAVRQNQEVVPNFLTVINVVLVLQSLPYLCYDVVCSFIRFFRRLLRFAS